jgi:hypothetical protein
LIPKEKKMAKRVPIDDTSTQVKDFLKRLDLENGEYVLEIAGKPLLGVVPAWQVEKLSQKRAEVLALLEQSWKRSRTVDEVEFRQVVSAAIKGTRRQNTPD